MKVSVKGLGFSSKADGMFSSCVVLGSISNSPPKTYIKNLSYREHACNSSSWEDKKTENLKPLFYTERKQYAKIADTI